ncbi:HAD family hydrolase [Moorella sulfitireducens]|uniref:HAD family hydrolase n=1 Tax=Neomoorella sulfitireducens TaxID=2972948 RepID=UPI0021ABD37A|nr:HAD family hydrolase [Moorella sulfitireducens]
MLIYEIPGRRIEIHQVVLDFNGTIARDGRLLPGVAGRLQALSGRLKVYILTADTFSTAASACRHLPVVLTTVDNRAGGPDKERIITELGAEHTAAIGNGANDAQMLGRAALGLLVLGPEGAAVQTLLQADVVFTSILDALDFLLKPRRVVATLRP